MTHYLQSITPALALGGELVYHQRPGEEGAVTSLIGRYTGKAFCDACNVLELAKLLALVSFTNISITLTIFTSEH